jgi:PAS domain-containing protein
MNEEKIFMLGDSRTGTTSLHEYMRTLGVSSIHYYPKEANVTEPYHIDRAQKWENLRKFIVSGEYQAFSDYPTRFFFREIIETFPDAYFILSIRRSIVTWRASMMKYFGVPKSHVDGLEPFYIAWNEEIVWRCKDLKRKFLKICIDDDDSGNALAICDFLGRPYAGKMGSHNAIREV